MNAVRITRAAVAHPPYRLPAPEAAALVGAAGGDPRAASAIVRGSAIDARNIALAPDEVQALAGSGERNDLYRRLAPPLAREAALRALGELPRAQLGCLVTSSCTGYMAPSLAAGLIEECGLRMDVERLPITEAGCAGGALALARAADTVRLRGGAALAVAVELCSLAFHAGGDEGNLTSSLIFGDAAGAVLLQPGSGEGLTVVDAMSVLVPGTQDLLGFDLTDQGFYPRLRRELVEALPDPTAEAATRLLARNGLRSGDVGAWLVHPGGSRILRRLEQRLGVRAGQMRWSWDAMREHGNTSSAAIYDVLWRYLDGGPRDEYAVVAAFGPGVWIELLLLRAEP